MAPAVARGAPRAAPVSSCATKSSTPPPSCCWKPVTPRRCRSGRWRNGSGVTPPSIYLHFADKDALLDAVCARYFEKLDEEMQRVAADQPSTIEVLRAQGLAYVRFAMQTPELYRIATMGEGRPGSDVDMTLNSSAFLHLRNSVESLMDEGIYPPGDPTTVALRAVDRRPRCCRAADLEAVPAVGRRRGIRRPDVVGGVSGPHRARAGRGRRRDAQQTVDWLLNRQPPERNS